MIITSQDKKNTLSNTAISHFHLDSDHTIWAYCVGNDETVLLGTYKTANKALDVQVEITDAIWHGRDYRMPADDALGGRDCDD